MSLSPTAREDLLLLIAGAQLNTAPVTLSIGHVSANGRCQHDSVLITDAPPAVLTAVLSWVSKSSDGDLTTAEIARGGLLVS